MRLLARRDLMCTNVIVVVSAKDLKKQGNKLFQLLVYFRDRLQCISTYKHATFDHQLQCVLFFTLQCRQMYFQSTKLTNIFYFGARFIHSLALDRN